MNALHPLNVLSLFNGISCGRIALERAGIPVANYYESEIDKYAGIVSAYNWPHSIQIGCVKKFARYFCAKDHLLSAILASPHLTYKTEQTIRHVRNIKSIGVDLLIAGSPCQGFSFAGKQLNFNDPRSALFFEFVRILRECAVLNPNIVFLLENVPMKKEYENVISNYVGVRPFSINGSLVSAQNRNRLFWFAQIRERLFFEEDFCYFCNHEQKNKRVLGKSQDKGGGKILGKTQGRYCNMQSLPNGIFENISQRNYEDMFLGVSGDKQKGERQKQGFSSEIGIPKRILSGKQNCSIRISETIPCIYNWQGGNEEGRFKAGQEGNKINEDSLQTRDCWGWQKTDKGRDFQNNSNEGGLRCLCCGKRLDNRPHSSFVEGRDKSILKPASSLSKVQFKQAKQDNGRVFDVIKIGRPGLDSLFGETIVDIPQPADKGILLADILEGEVDEKYFLSERALARIERNTYSKAKVNPDKTGTINTKNNSGQLSIDGGTTLIGCVNNNGQLQEVMQANCIDASYAKGMDNHGQSPLAVALRPRYYNDEGKKIYGKEDGFTRKGTIEINGDGTKSATITQNEKVNLAIAHNLMSRSSKKGNGGTGHLSKQDGKTYCVDANSPHAVEILGNGGAYHQSDRVNMPGRKSRAVESHATGEFTGKCYDYSRIRRLTPTEVCRLFTIPDNYFHDKDGKRLVSESQQYKALGNGWIVDVIAHIFSFIK